jgi:Bacterial pre-peptidase C-terminal domain
LPLALNGRIQTAGDVDFFKFTAKAGQTWEIECYAQRLGSPSDPVVNIYKADKAHLAGNDDARAQDSYFRWQVPADGEYFVRINDHLGKGGETYVYRVELAPVTPTLKIGIPRVDRYSQTRQTIVVPRGNRYGTLILGTRADFGGPLELKGEGLPPDVTFTARPMHPSMNLMPVVFEAAEDAPIDGELFDLRAKLADPNQPAVSVEGGFENLADFVLGEPNNAVYVSGIAQKVAIAVAEKVPFRLEIVQPKAPLVRSGTMNMKVLVHRDAGFDAPIYVQFPFTPPGVGAAGAINIEKGQNEGLYPLNANGDAMLGKWPVMAIGAAEINGQAWVSSQLAELEIAEPFVTFTVNRASCDQGQPAQVPCTITHNAPFEGKAQAQLLGLPPGVAAAPVEFTKDTAELVFQVTTAKETPVGSHKTLFCQVNITQNGELVVGTVGTTELQVNAPPVVAAAPVAAATTPTEPAPAAPKPLSRLQQLRAKVLKPEATKP